MKVGAFLPTFNRPDLARACVLQLAAQSRVPDLICVHQNGSPINYEWCVADLRLDKLQWLHSPEKLPQHQWYLRPLQQLLDAQCTHFFWIDHDDIYLRDHVATRLAELEDNDFTIATHCGVLYVRQSAYRFVPESLFNVHAPGGMSSSMAFTRDFALQLAKDIAADSQETYTDNIVAKVTMPRFRTFSSARKSTIYVSHDGSQTSAGWLTDALATTSVSSAREPAHAEPPVRRSRTRQPALRMLRIAWSKDDIETEGPGFERLDNSHNPRPDWYEYWPIREYLLSTPLDEDALYGFFSPKFEMKTGWTADRVCAEVAACPTDEDVILLSPMFDQGAVFRNVFEQCESYEPGSLAAYQAFFDDIGRRVDLAQSVMDSRNTVFCNYFLARPAFWREWLQLTEKVFAACEAATTPVGRLLASPSQGYHGQPAIKVFLIERMASFLLTTQPWWRVSSCKPFDRLPSTAWFGARNADLLALDALKGAYLDTKQPRCLEAFYALRTRLLQAKQS